jgi:Pyruvate/2-oxoacid:ferredoxin oxidoreductase gamma subunit
MVALGALIGKTNLLEKDAVIEVVRDNTKKAAQVETNVQAVEAGFQFARASMADDGLWGV